MKDNILNNESLMAVTADDDSTAGDIYGQIEQTIRSWVESNPDKISGGEAERILNPSATLQDMMDLLGGSVESAKLVAASAEIRAEINKEIEESYPDLSDEQKALADPILHPIEALKQSWAMYHNFFDSIKNAKYSEMGLVGGIWIALFSGAATILLPFLYPLKAAATPFRNSIERENAEARAKTKASTIGLHGRVNTDEKPHYNEEAGGESTETFGVAKDDQAAISSDGDATDETFGVVTPRARVYMSPLPGYSVGRRDFGEHKWPGVGKRYDGTKMHFGVDISAPKGVDIVAPMDGEVAAVKFIRGYGKVVLFQDTNGYCHLFGHCSDTSAAKQLKKDGTKVKKGDPVGALVGNTGRSSGPHLHWEVWAADGSGCNSSSGAKLDPETFLGHSIPHTDDCIDQDLCPGAGGYIDPLDLIYYEDATPAERCALKPTELYSFIKAIHTQESGYGPVSVLSGSKGLGGVYFNISDANWHGSGRDNQVREVDSWSHAHLPADNREKTVENEKVVAKEKISEYFNKFCNWEKVAMAWYKGDSLIEQLNLYSDTLPDGNYLSLKEYVDSILALYGAFNSDINRRISNNEDISSFLAEYDIKDDKSTQSKIAASFKY